MSGAASSALSARLRADYASAAPALPASGAARRRAALEALAAAGLPSARDENWKYANLRPLERQRFAAVAPVAPAQLPAGLPAPLAGAARYVFLDGAPLAPRAAAPRGIEVTPLSEALGDAAPARPAVRPDERLALLNQAFGADGLAIRVPAEVDGPEAAPARLELLFVASAEAHSGASYPSVALRLEPGARLALIERHVSAHEAASFVSSAVTVELARGARLEHYRLQELNARSILFDTLAADLAGEASYRLHAFNTGAQAARSTLGVRLAGERAALSLAVLALGDRQQVQDAYAVVEHAAAAARTEQVFRGIAAGRARVAFNGKIVVAPGARGTDSRQSLRGLLAGAEAEIDLRPQLEIHTDEVKCSHGATAGKLDADMLFYLLSRGLDPEAAQRLLKWAFLEDVIARIALPELRRQIEARLVGQLRDEALQELL